MQRHAGDLRRRRPAARLPTCHAVAGPWPRRKSLSGQPLRPSQRPFLPARHRASAQPARPGGPASRLPAQALTGVGVRAAAPRLANLPTISRRDRLPMWQQANAPPNGVRLLGRRGHRRETCGSLVCEFGTATPWRPASVPAELAQGWPGRDSHRLTCEFRWAAAYPRVEAPVLRRREETQHRSRG